MRAENPMTGVPEGMPWLAAGHHRRPETGACIMEYVSLLAGERFSDHPRCVHPMLAGLARRINDRVGAGARQQLGALAADMVGTDRADSRRVSGALIDCCARTGLAVDPAHRGLQRLRTRTARRLARLDRGGLAGVLARAGHHPGWLVFASAYWYADSILAPLDGADRDRRLCELLAAATRECRRLADVSAPDAAVPAPDAVVSAPDVAVSAR